MVDYPVADELNANPAAWCASLVIVDHRLSEASQSLIPQPNAGLRSGTLTFVKSEGRTFGITCQHVVDAYRNAIAESDIVGSHSLRTMVNGYYVIGDRFHQPSAQWPDLLPDVAITELNPALVEKIGKRAFDLDTMADVPERIKHGVATGFPESLKRNSYDSLGGYRVAMPQVTIVAEIEDRPRRRFAMFSQLSVPTTDISYSGMSGGPICWSDDQEHFGVMGIIYEGGTGDRNNSIYVYGELANPETIRGWIAELPKRT